VSESGRRESHKERIDRELIELLNELRVALPGVQVLFAFLLTMPFTQQFTKVSTVQRSTYYVAFLSTAIASVLLIAPTAIHRLRFREQDKEHVLQTSNKLAITGMAFLALAIVTVVFVISDFLYGAPLSLIASGVIAVLAVGIWYALPLLRQART
jgi:amino acid transporter